MSFADQSGGVVPTKGWFKSYNVWNDPYIPSLVDSKPILRDQQMALYPNLSIHQLISLASNDWDESIIKDFFFRMIALKLFGGASFLGLSLYKICWRPSPWPIDFSTMDSCSIVNWVRMIMDPIASFGIIPLEEHSIIIFMAVAIDLIQFSKN